MLGAISIMKNKQIKVSKNIPNKILISAIATVIAIVPLVPKHPVQASEQDLIPVCGDESPCMLDYDASQSGNNAIFKWKSGNANSYNVRYRSGGQEKQVGNTSGSFTLTNVKPNSIYKIKVQACKSRFLARSKCSDWLEMSFATTRNIYNR
jgi:hypothetical protein